MKFSMRKTLRQLVCVMGLLSILISGCRSVQTAARIPVIEKPALVSSSQKILVVVLPGRGDTVENLQSVGIADAIQSSMPQADVILTGISLSYYMQGQMPQRLHTEIIQPARERGYREIYLVGASMGGMGVLLHERDYSESIAGIVLLAPYVGRRGVLTDIQKAGGLEKWDAGPKASALNADNFDRELWRHLQTWQNDGRDRTQNVWLAYGKQDRLGKPIQPLLGLLPQQHIYAREGGHAWKVWAPAAKEIFSAIESKRKGNPVN